MGGKPWEAKEEWGGEAIVLHDIGNNMMYG